MGQLFALAAGHREGVAGSASALIQSAKMRSYINYESLATDPRSDPNVVVIRKTWGLGNARCVSGL